MNKNKVDLRLLIVDFNDISHDEITNMLGIKPTYIRLKGTLRNPKNLQSPVWPTNVWSMDSGLGVYAPFEDQMNTILNIIESRMEVLGEFSKKYYLEFACAIYSFKDNEESTPWVHLDKRYNKIAAEINVEFDVDLYAW